MESLINYLQKILKNEEESDFKIKKYFKKDIQQKAANDIISFVINNKNKISNIYLNEEQKNLKRKIGIKYKCDCGEECTSYCRNIDSFKFTCKKCTAQKNGSITTLKSKDEFLEDLFKKHPHFSNKKNWDFSESNYINNYTDLEYICLTHNINCSQNPSNLLVNGNFGCKICSSQGNSKEAIMFLEFFSMIFDKNIIHSYNNSDGEHCLDNYRRPIDGYIENIDYNFIEEKLKEYSLEYLLENIKFYLKDLNNNFNKLAIEYNGSYSHGNPTKYKKDSIIIHKKIAETVWKHDTEKYETYNKNGYNVLVIWDTDFKDKIKKTYLYKKYEDKIKKKTNTYDFSKVKKTENERKQISNSNKKRNLDKDNRAKYSSTKQNNLPLNISICNGGFDYTYANLIYYKFSNKKLSLKYRYDCAIKIKTLVDNYLNEFNIKNKIPTEEDKELLKQKADELKKTIYDNEINKNQKKLTTKKFVYLNKIFDTNFITIKEVYDNENNKIIGYELKKSINMINYCKKIYLKEEFSKSLLNNRENFANTKDECLKFIKNFVYKKYIINILKENFINRLINIEKPHKCEKCNISFKFKSQLEKHCKTELHKTGKKKTRSDKKEEFKCEICNLYTTNQQTNLKLHILNNHKTKEERKNEFPYYCELCDSGCMEEKLYKKHLETKKHKKKLDLLSK